METINHFQLAAEIFLGEMVEHACVNQTLHEGAAVLWQTERGKPAVADPLVVHVTKRQRRS